jgi:TDG/mug DNA glycosylase family protein
VDRATVERYEVGADVYAASKPPRFLDRAAAFAGRCLPGRPVVDLGCGPGGYLPALPPPVVALDAAMAMLRLARAEAPDAPGVQADLVRLPFRDRSLGGAWSRNSHLHLRKVDLPLALARLHWALDVDAPLEMSVATGDHEEVSDGGDIPGRLFAFWRPDHLVDVVVGAGFHDVSLARPEDDTWVLARRARTLPDTVGPGMRLLVCGLNPSLYSADRGVGFARPGNRFWPAAVAAGLVTRPRDPLHALLQHGVGMTDLVKRATVAASELDVDEYRDGVGRVRRLVEWLRPGAVVFVGLAGWRAAIDRRARAGPVEDGFAGVPAYVMPSTSGLNASSQVRDLVAHVRAATDLAPAPGR